MSMLFRYSAVNLNRQILTLQKRVARPRPIIPVTIIGPSQSLAGDALVDTGADDTIFPDLAALKIGLDLTAAPTSFSRTISPGGVRVRYARVALRIGNVFEHYEWEAWVGFTPQLWRPILGFAGFLQFFDATFFGAREELELTVNPTYSGS